MTDLATVFQTGDGWDLEVYAHAQQRLGIIRGMASELTVGRRLSQPTLTGLVILEREHNEPGLTALVAKLASGVDPTTDELQPLFELAAQYDAQLHAHADVVGMASAHLQRVRADEFGALLDTMPTPVAPDEATSVDLAPPAWAECSVCHYQFTERPEQDADGHIKCPACGALLENG